MKAHHMIKPEPRKKGPIKKPPDKPQPLPECEALAREEISRYVMLR